VQTAVELALIAWGAATGRGFATMVDYLSPIYWLFLTDERPCRSDPAAAPATCGASCKVPLYPMLPLLFAGSCACVFCSSVLYVGWSGCSISFGVMALGLLVRTGFRKTVKG